MVTTTEFDQAKMEAFLGKVLTDTSGTVVTVLATIGDQLGLFKNLVHGPATSEELAMRTGLQERYVREWLAGMASAGYLEFDPDSRRFTLPAEHVPVLAQEGGPAFFGGVHEELIGVIKPIDRVIDAFRRGGGVPPSAFGGDVWEGVERFTAGWFNNLLMPQWIPAMPDLQAKLEAGAVVADVGCGHGRAIIRMAQEFPNSRFVGYDAYGPAIVRAAENAEAAGVADRVRFEQCDASKGLPDTYDVITTFDVVHDAVDPRGMLRSVRTALNEDGIYACIEVNSSDRLEENAGPIGSLLYGFSVLFCMTMSLSGHGEGLGTLGLPESKLRELCTEAGFSAVRRVPMENPFNSLYEIRR
jgi:SAM-dependent methyltransferase